MNDIEVVHLDENCLICLGSALVQKVVIQKNLRGEIVKRLPGSVTCLDCRTVDGPRRAALVSKIN